MSMRLIIAILVLCGVFVAGYVYGIRGGSLPSHFMGVQNTTTSAVSQKDTEVIPQESETETVVSEPTFLGTWRSEEDQKFTREFRDDGSVVDRYEGEPEATSEGTWISFTQPTAIEAPFTIQPGVTYLRVDFGEEILYFSVSKLTDTDLELVYLGRGNTLRFSRVH